MKVDRRTRVAVEAVVSAVVLGLLLRWAGLHEVAKTLRGTDLAWFLPAVVVSAATVPVMALRWQLLLEAKGGVSVPVAWLTRTYFVALFAGQFLPAAIGGDAVRVVELGRRTGDAPEAVASVLIDRLVGLVSLVVLAVVAVLVSGPGGRFGVVAVEGAFGIAAAAALLLLFSSRLRGAVARWLEPRASGRRLAAGGRFYEALHAYRAHRATLVAVGLLALVVQAARVGVIWMLARALGLHVPDSVVLLAGPVVFAALALPVSLNGIGVREAVFVYFLHGHATRPEAIALGLAFFAVGTLTALGGAVVLVVRFIRYGVGAVRPRTQMGEPPGAKGD